MTFLLLVGIYLLLTDAPKLRAVVLLSLPLWAILWFISPFVFTVGGFFAVVGCVSFLILRSAARGFGRLLAPRTVTINNYQPPVQPPVQAKQVATPISRPDQNFIVRPKR